MHKEGSQESVWSGGIQKLDVTEVQLPAMCQPRDVCQGISDPWFPLLNVC